MRREPSSPRCATSGSGSSSSSSTCCRRCRPGATSSSRSSTPASPRPSAAARAIDGAGPGRPGRPRGPPPRRAVRRPAAASRPWRGPWSPTPSSILADEPTGNLDSRLDRRRPRPLRRAARPGPHHRAHHPRARRRRAGPARRAHPRRPASSRTASHSRAARPMTWAETFRTAYDAIRTRRMRSALTMLGILIGIAAVMLTVGLGQGAQQQVASQINKLGLQPAHRLARVQHQPERACAAGCGSATTLTTSDAATLADRTVAPDIAAVAPVVEHPGVTHRERDELDDERRRHDARLARGAGPVRWRSDGSSPAPELDTAQTEVVLGATTAQELFGVRDPVGQTVDDRLPAVHRHRRAGHGRLDRRRRPGRPGGRACDDLRDRPSRPRSGTQRLDDLPRGGGVGLAVRGIPGGDQTPC